MKAATMEWRSWLWQCTRLGKGLAGLEPGLRLFVDSGGFGTLPEVCCRAAFWGMSRASIVEFAKELHISIESGSDLFAVLWKVTQGVLGISDEDTLELVHKRVARDSNETPLTDALMELDEAVSVLDKHDMDMVKERQKQLVTEKAARQAFKNSYCEKASVVKGGGKSRSSRSAGSLPQPLTLPHHCEQREARSFIPPGTSIWRDCARGGWCAHHNDYRRISEGFTKHGGSMLALRHCLRRLWGQYLEARGEPLANCPVSGLFDGDTSPGED